jgi:hypothetical protein
MLWKFTVQETYQISSLYLLLKFIIIIIIIIAEVDSEK